MSFIAELKRRNVVRVGIAYVVAAWLLLQLTEVLTELLEIGPEVGKIVIVLIIVGFVPALIFAWAFELTPEGIKRESEVDRSSSVAPQTGQKLNIAIIAMLVLIAGYFIWESRFKTPAAQDIAETMRPADGQAATELSSVKPSAPDAVEQTVQKSIVVLPFVNMSADASQEYFSDGLSEEILNALVPIENLRVISRTSAFAFKDKDLSVPQIAEQLGVTHVLEGSVRTAGDDLRITAQLIEVASDSHLWSQAYNRKMENVFEVQEEISLAIAEQLQLRLSEQALGEAQTNNMEAYTLFLRGRHHYQSRVVENLFLAEDLLSQAVALDPQFDEAWANLAATFALLAFHADEGFDAYFLQADQAARKAIEINPDNGFAHAVLGLLAYGRLEFEAGLKQLELAIRLNPNESNAYLWQGIALFGLGYIDQATAVFKQAETFDPAFSNLHNWLASIYLSQGDIAAALHHRDILAKLDPAFPINDFGDPDLYGGDLDLAEAKARARLAGLADSEQLIAAYYAALRDPARREMAIRVLRSFDTQSWQNPAYYWLLRLGAVGEALEIWQRLNQAGRGLRAANVLSGIWTVSMQENLQDPAIVPFFEETGVADYWRKHGDPDYCRPVGDSFACGTP